MCDYIGHNISIFRDIVYVLPIFQTNIDNFCELMSVKWFETLFRFI